ncbi:hypothetical protein ACWDBC_27325 [Streptomyces parvus]
MPSGTLSAAKRPAGPSETRQTSPAIRAAADPLQLRSLGQPQTRRHDDEHAQHDDGIDQCGHDFPPDLNVFNF